jgi:plasmid stabilization system protein ParE
MLDLIILDDAEDDLLNAYNWYEAKEHGLGDRFLSSVQDGLTLIRQHPEIFPVSLVECRRALISKFPFEIIYEKKENRVVVYSVFNCSQNPQKWKSRISPRRNE